MTDLTRPDDTDRHGPGGLASLSRGAETYLSAFREMGHHVSTVSARTRHINEFVEWAAAEGACHGRF